MMRTTLSIALALGCLICLPLVQAQPKQPNIVLVFIDDMGWADFSSFGNTAVETQHIDRLAREGVRFEQFYVNSPICSPSRVAISTGHYPQRWRITSYLNNRKNNIKRGMAQWLDPLQPERTDHQIAALVCVGLTILSVVVSIFHGLQFM